MRVLVVENNIEMRRFIKSLIGEIAEEIHESSGGEGAVDLYKTLRPDWVVMDIFRKPENGLTVAASIKGMDPDAKIVFVSNYTDERTRDWAKSAGGAAFFGKDDLLGLVGFLKSKTLCNGQL
jgi:CheY-like chemotaxis protein